jgi:hypothetical protein
MIIIDILIILAVAITSAMIVAQKWRKDEEREKRKSSFFDFERE